jgi:ubiquinone/menaquinone biosynthesis C-methylase UbiE
LHALAELGFTRLEGVDLSPTLLAEYAGPAKCYVADCRKLPFADASRDVVVVQGGLHHLETLPDDLTATLREARRVLRRGGLFVTVEPWLTPFLKVVHLACARTFLRRLWPKLDALATMNELERVTYNAWLGQPVRILSALHAEFASTLMKRRWGKLLFVGTPLA